MSVAGHEIVCVKQLWILSEYGAFVVRF